MSNVYIFATLTICEIKTKMFFGIFSFADVC